MTLADFIDCIYKKYEKDFPTEYWDKFKAEPFIKSLNEYLYFPLYSDNYSFLNEEVNNLLQDEVTNLLKDKNIRSNFLKLLKKISSEIPENEVSNLLSQADFSSHEILLYSQLFA